jgi:hypothetical protein
MDEKMLKIDLKFYDELMKTSRNDVMQLFFMFFIRQKLWQGWLKLKLWHNFACSWQQYSV